MVLGACQMWSCAGSASTGRGSVKGSAKGPRPEPLPDPAVAALMQGLTAQLALHSLQVRHDL